MDDIFALKKQQSNMLFRNLAQFMFAKKTEAFKPLLTDIYKKMFAVRIQSWNYAKSIWKQWTANHKHKSLQFCCERRKNGDLNWLCG